MARKHFAGLLFIFGVLILASRLPLAPGQLFSFDDVNFAYAIGDFDPRASQPQPPGYPLFVLQTKILFWLRFKRPESNLLALAMIGSTAALAALAWFGNRMLRSDAGLCAAWLLLFHHSFWYAGLTSAVRVQLAVVSVVAAAFCYRTWNRERKWVNPSAVALGAGAGIRPELGLVLFPLWATGVWRAAPVWKERARALGLLAIVLLAWLTPTVIESGGPAKYLEICLDYAKEQSALTSPLFGAEERRWQSTAVWFCVWTLSGLLALSPAALLAWRSAGGLTWMQAAFFAVWFLPSAAFALLVHIADAGQALAMVPIVCLLGGHWISRASSRQDAWLPRAHGLVLLLLPSFFLNALIFFTPGWYYQGSSTSGWRAGAEEIWSHVHSGMSFTSLAHVRGIAWVDDIALGQLRRLAADAPHRAVVIWEQGRTSWRKTAYYFQDLPVIVLGVRELVGTAAPAGRIVKGPRVVQALEGPLPLRVPLPAEARVIWMVEPKSAFFSALRKSFPLQDADPVYYLDLPEGGGSRQVGNYLFVW